VKIFLVLKKKFKVWNKINPSVISQIEIMNKKVLINNLAKIMLKPINTKMD
jgi:hypothetical protein